MPTWLEKTSLGTPAAFGGEQAFSRELRFSLPSPCPLKGEIYHDDDGIITGVAQTFGEGTLTLEATPWEHLLIKFEGRYDCSSQAVFFNSRGDATSPGLSKGQFILLLSAVATGAFPSQ